MHDSRCGADNAFTFGQSDCAISDPSQPDPDPERTPDIRETVFIIKKETQPGQDLMIFGGKAGCPGECTSCGCEIDISAEPVDPEVWSEYEASRQKNNQLHWMGSSPDGTPLRWTTNDPENPTFDELNTFGPHYWMVKMAVDCSQTTDGWMALRICVKQGDHVYCEHDISQAECAGGPNPSPRFIHNMHYARYNKDTIKS